MKGMGQLVKLNLSHNNLMSLPNDEILSTLVSLRILFLDNNNFRNWKDIEFVFTLKHLYHLTLNNNPLCYLPAYRNTVIKYLPHL